MKASIRSVVTSLLVVSLATPAIQTRAEMLAPDVEAATRRERVVAVLQRPDVRTQLIAHGVDAAQAEARVAALTDDEAAQLAAGIDEIPAGGNVVVLVVAAYLVLGLLAHVTVRVGHALIVGIRNR